MVVLLVAQALPLFNSSSESDMEDEQEEQDQEEEEEEAEQPPASPSDLGGVPWKEAVELHAKLRGSHGALGEAGVDTVSGDGELEEEEDDEEEEEEEDEEEEDEDSSEGIFLRTFLAFSPVCVSSEPFFQSLLCVASLSQICP